MNTKKAQTKDCDTCSSATNNYEARALFKFFKTFWFSVHCITFSYATMSSYIIYTITKRCKVLKSLIVSYYWHYITNITWVVWLKFLEVKGSHLYILPYICHEYVLLDKMLFISEKMKNLHEKIKTKLHISHRLYIHEKVSSLTGMISSSVSAH